MHLFTLLFTTIVAVLPILIASEPLVLTDKTWRDMLCGQWMVEFYAPWCPSCQHFKSTWAEFAKAMVSKDIKVAEIDINQYPSLSGRFGISVLPTIYYVRDGVFRQFNGERSLNGLKKYIELQEWQRTSPVSPYFAPDSIPMSIVGAIFDVSLMVKDAYTVLLEQYGWPAWLIYIVLALAVILVGLILGFGVLMIIDYCLTGSSSDETVDIPDDSRDVDEEDLDEDETEQKSNQIQTKKSKPTLIASSTPQRPSQAASKTSRSSPPLPLQNEGELLEDLLANDNDDSDEEDDDDDDEEVEIESQGSDAVEGSDDENDDQPTQTKQTLRQRRGKH